MAAMPAAPTLLHIDRKTKEQIAIDQDGKVTWTRGGQPMTFTAVANKQPASFHYPDRTFFAVEDLKTFVAGANATSERVMQWTAGDANALYREVVRFDDRVLIVWGRNNARDLQSVGLIASEADARALVQAMRDAPLKGFKATSPYFIDGRGGIVREYWPVPETGKHGDVERGVGRCLDNRVEWTTRYPEYEREELIEELETDEAAERRFDALELDWYRRGGRPYEIEWMKTAKRRASYSIYDWFRFHGDRPDTKAYATKLLGDAHLDATQLPDTFAAICTVLHAMPEAHWVRVGETVGTVARKPGPKPNTEILLDHALHTVTTVARDKKGSMRSVAVKRAKSADAAKALFGE
jgi:hypothetical protein